MTKTTNQHVRWRANCACALKITASASLGEPPLHSGSSSVVNQILGLVSNISSRVSSTMDGVSAESNAQFIAFRRLVYSFSEQVSREECQAIVYIRLYRSRERYKASSTLEVLSRLEADGVFGPTNPQGLLEITKDIKRQDLASEVKDFIKKRSKSEKKASGGSGGKKGANLYTFQGGEDLNDDDTEEDLQLRATIEVTLAQATVLMQQVEILERAVAEGKAQRQRAKEAIAEAGQTAAALADRLRKAQDVLGLGAGEKGAVGSLPLTVPGRSFHAEDQQPFYSNIDYPGKYSQCRLHKLFLVV